METPKKAHFIGICGIGMASVAVLLKNTGWGISGSDDGFYPPVSDFLKQHDITLLEGYRKENIPEDAEIIIIGKNAKLTPEENKEVNAALESGKTIRSFPETLASLFETTSNIVIAGSFAKSTCTALAAFILEHAGKDPSYFIGAIPINSEETTRLGKSKVAILEGDEYPSSNWDETSKFLYYKPHDVLLTSAEHDHVNVFPTHEEYLTPFKTLLSLIPEDGLLVASADDESSLALAHTHTGKTVLYGLNQSQKSYDISYDFWSADHIIYDMISSFTLTKNGEKVVALETQLLGKHNVQNIIGVSALLLEKQLVTPEELRTSLLEFKGVKRRLDLLSQQSSVRVYEGFGSSYSKARAAIETMKLHFPDRRLIVVFEPHTFSWRNRDALHWYDTVFKGAEKVLIYEPASQGAQTHKQLAQDEIVERVQKTGINTRAVHTAEETLELLDKELKADDVILLSTSGDLGGLIEKMPDFVEDKFPVDE